MTTTVVNIRSIPLVAGRRVLPDDVVYIGRAVHRQGLRASRWANPYRIGQPTRRWDGDDRPMTRSEAYWAFAEHLKEQLRADSGWLEPLRGKTLACWCVPDFCHGNLIVEWFETHPRVPQSGEPIEFGLHRQPERDAETAPAWPSRTTFRRRFDEAHRRGLRRMGQAVVVLLVLAALAFAGSSPARAGDPGCRRIPITWWSPTGVVGCRVYGEGTASMWGGPGAARNDCEYPWTDCQTIAVESLTTGLRIVVTPTMYGDLYLGDADPTNDRIVDLDPAMVAALGLDPADGLWPVRVTPVDADGFALPDTSIAP